MKKLKLMTIVGTRPEIIKLSEVIKKSDIYFEHILVHTGQNYDYELNQIFFENLGIRMPNFYLNVVGDNLGQTMGNILAKSYEIMLLEKPDALLVLGDTNSCLSVISAKRLKIPIFHMEAGNRCFDENLPEEINRKIVDHTSDVNLCYTEHARNYLNWEGFSKERTFVIGSPMSEVLKRNKEKICNSDILKKLKLYKGKYILLSAHREENMDNQDNFINLMKSINKISETYNITIIYSIHPRSKKIIKERGFIFDKNIRSLKPFGFSDYIKLQENALCVISDSGTLAEESSLLNFPAVSLRTSTERPEAIDKGNLIIGNLSSDKVLQSVELAIEMFKNNDIGERVDYYKDENVSNKVIKIIQSYTEIINKVVWKKT
jgi:UDP-N-acetyl-L-fucosamine synthase